MCRPTQILTVCWLSIPTHAKYWPLLENATAHIPLHTQPHTNINSPTTPQHPSASPQHHLPFTTGTPHTVPICLTAALCRGGPMCTAVVCPPPVTPLSTHARWGSCPPLPLQRCLHLGAWQCSAHIQHHLHSAPTTPRHHKGFCGTRMSSSWCM